MRTSEIRSLQREKHNSEYSGTSLSTQPVDLLEPLSFTSIQITAMKEEVRNEVAKTCARSLSNQFKADWIKDNFTSACALYEKKSMTAENLRELYQGALKNLSELKEY